MYGLESALKADWPDGVVRICLAADVTRSVVMEDARACLWQFIQSTRQTGWLRNPSLSPALRINNLHGFDA